MYGKIGVNLFVLITGYFGIKERFNIKKILKIECETLFASYLLYIVSAMIMFAKDVQFDKIKLFEQGIKLAFPTIFGSYWYSAAFIILCFIKPFLNKLITALDQTQLRGFIIVLLIIYCVIPTFTLQINSGYGWNNYLWMPIPYIIGGYIRQYRESFAIRKNKLICIIIATNILHLFPTLLFDTIWDGKLNGPSIYLYHGNSITSVIISVALFLFVINKESRNIKAINFIATGTFSCYLIEEHPVFRDIFWNKLVNVPTYQNNICLIFILLITVITLLVLGTIFHKVCGIMEKVCLKKVFEKSIHWEDFLNRKVYGYYD